MINPGGTNERFAKRYFPYATLIVYPDNVTLFQESLAGKADVMVTDASETMLQERVNPGLCSVDPDKPCSSRNYGATRLNVPAPGTYPDTNPPRIAPRNLFDFGLGTDDVFHYEKFKTTLKLEAVNISNAAALYNLLSTFSGTHWVTPCTFQVTISFAF